MGHLLSLCALGQTALHVTKLPHTMLAATLVASRRYRPWPWMQSRPRASLSGPGAVERTFDQLPPKRFGQLRVRPWLASALRAAGYRDPTPVQAAVMERISRHEDTVIHAETGSGKTLGFLVPLLSRLDAGIPAQLLILVPSRELAMQTASEVDRLLVPDSELRTQLMVGGIVGAATAVQMPPSAPASSHDTHGIAEVLIATPHALARALGLGRTGRSLLDPATPPAASHAMALAIGAHLDALVLDEVDALLPKPVLNQKLGYYRQKDWAKGMRAGRRETRPGGSRSSIAARLVQRILETVATTRSATANPLVPRAAQASLANTRVHMVAASATVSRGLLMQLRALFSRTAVPAVVGASGRVHREPSGRALGEATAGGRRGGGLPGSQIRRGSGQRGVAGVGLPRTITHRVLSLSAQDDPAAATCAALKSLQPQAALVVLPDEASVAAWADSLRSAGASNVELLHEAMGFTRRSGDGARKRRSTLAECLKATQDVRRGIKRDPGADQSRVLVTTERSVRGIDLPGLDCVILMYVPLTSDTYVHMAGRTGRSTTEGTALSIIPADETKRLGLFSSQLAVSIKPWRPATSTAAL